MKASKKAAKKLAFRITDWDKVPGGTTGRGGKVKMAPGGNAFRKPGSQNPRQHR